MLLNLEGNKSRRKELEKQIDNNKLLENSDIENIHTWNNYTQILKLWSHRILLEIFVAKWDILKDIYL